MTHTLLELERQALHIINNAPFEKEGMYVGHSGGKDSVVVHYLATQALGPAVLSYHNVKQETHPLTTEFLTGVPNITYLQEGEFPPLPTQIDGTRVSEHNRQDGRSVDFVLGGKNVSRTQLTQYVENGLFGKNFVYPIYNWTDEQVWAYIRFRNLKYSKEYDA